MSQYKYAAPFIIVAILAYLIWRAEEAGIAAIVALLSLGMGFAFLYRPDFSPMRMVVTRNRHDLALLAMSIVAAFNAIGCIDWLFQPHIPSDYQGRALLAEQIVRGLYLAVGSIALLPFLGQIVRTHRNPDRLVAQWPAAIGPAAAVLIGVAVFILWGGFGQWAVTEAPSEAGHLVGAITVMGMAGLLAGIGAPLWWRTMTAGDAAQFDSNGIFSRAMHGMAAGIAIGAVLAASGALLPDISGQSNGLLWGAALSLVTAGAWLVVLSQTRDLEPSGPRWATVTAVGTLLLLFPVTLFPAGAVASSDGWAALVLVICGPVSIGMAVLVVRRMPDALRSLVGAAKVDRHWPVVGQV